MTPTAPADDPPPVATASSPCLQGGGSRSTTPTPGGRHPEGDTNRMAMEKVESTDVRDGEDFIRFDGNGSDVSEVVEIEDDVEGAFYLCLIFINIKVWLVKA